MSSYTADRQGHVYKNDSGQDRLLEKMYGCAPGRAVLKPLVNPVLSELGGRILDSRLSALAVPAFIRHAGIDMRDYEKKKFRSYNDFFTRRIREGARPVSMVPEHFVSPCDSRVSVYPIDGNCRVKIKHTPYTVAELLKNPVLAKRYEGGYLWVFRLCVDITIDIFILMMVLNQGECTLMVRCTPSIRWQTMFIRSIKKIQENMRCLKLSISARSL